MDRLPTLVGIAKRAGDKSHLAVYARLGIQPRQFQNYLQGRNWPGVGFWAAIRKHYHPRPAELGKLIEELFRCRSC